MYVYQGSLATLKSWEGDAGIDLVVTNEFGQQLQSAEIGENLLIRSNITSHAAEELSFVHVVQIKDPSDRVIFINSTAFDLKSGDTQTARAMWHSEIEGDHTIQVFAWQNVESPVTFSFLFAQVRIDPESDLRIECSGSGACFKGIVTKVIDGDTIKVNDITIRLALVDTPERREIGYQEATSYTARLCPEGSEVFVDEDDGQTSGSYGRMIAKVYCGGKVINEGLLVSKNAIILAEFCAESEFSIDEWAKRYGC
jgi:endonuclease YncB( thermonuclease family)